MLGSTLLYYKSLTFIQFLLFLVMSFYFSQNLSFIFLNFTCLTLTLQHMMRLSCYHGHNKDSTYQ